MEIKIGEYKREHHHHDNDGNDDNLILKYDVDANDDHDDCFTVDFNHVRITL